MRRPLTLLLASVVALLLVAGTACGGDDDDSDGDEGQATATIDSGDEPTETDDSGDEPTETDDSADEPDADAVAYFEAADDIQRFAYEDLVAISGGIEGVEFDSEQDEIERKQFATQQFGETLEGAFVDLADLDPPADAEAEHDGLIEALQDYAARISFFLEDLQDVKTKEELEEVAADHNSGLEDAYSQYDAACLSLESRGAEVIDGFDMTCPSD